MSSRRVASGPGWQVSDVSCTAGPNDRPFEERHEDVSIAVVTQGTFQYRTTSGAAVLVPGAVLLGNHGDCFECGHEHGVGDRCLAFHFAPDFLETIAAAAAPPGARRIKFAVPRLPPLPRLMPLIAAAEAARDDRGGERSGEMEELAVMLAGSVLAELAAADLTASRPSPRDERRATEALRRIEAHADEPLALTGLARDAAMSPYHFLRAFRHVVGMTPYQYVLRTRLHRAAVRLRRSEDPVSAIAFEAGFNDLSTFNHRFRRIMGVRPTAYRAQRRSRLGA
jgi:AraC-like DNA-binding protein